MMIADLNAHTTASPDHNPLRDNLKAELAKVETTEAKKT